MIATDKVLLNDWHVVAKVEDCPPGKIITRRLLGEDLVLWRPLDPQAPVQAWLDRCPHRGAPLSLGKVCDRTLACLYHGWEYDTTGKCVHIPPHPNLDPPAGARIKTYHCQERYGWVWVCLGNPSCDVPAFPEWDDPSYHRFWSGPFNCNASAFRLVDIGLDVTHFRFLHKEIMGMCDPRIHQDYEVEVTPDKIIVPRRTFTEGSEGKQISYSTSVSMKVCPSLTLYSNLEVPEGPYKGRFAFLTAMTPVEEEKSMQWCCTVTNSDPTLLPQWLAVDEQVQQEDIWMVEYLRPKRLPLVPPTDTQWPADLHVLSDRACVSYRKWLKQLGITFGVC